MSFLSEFKTFALRGNVMDMAVGVIIGASFGTIVNSLVSDVIMPPIGLLVGGVDFSKLAVVLKHATETSPEVVIKYGVFINAVISFMIVAFAVFLLVKTVNKLSGRGPVTTKLTADQQLLTEIRDLLKKEN